MTEEQKLMSRLQGLRRKIRLLFTLHGLGRLLALVPPAILLVVLLDYVINFPSVLRAVLLAGVMVLTVFVVVRYLWRPLRTRFGLQDVAQELEGRFPELDDRLATTVNFVESRQDRPGESATLRQAVIRETLQRTEQMPFDQALQPRPLLAIFALGLAVTLAIGGLGVAYGREAGIGLERLFNPLSQTRWPKRTVLLLTEKNHVVIPIGGDYQARVQVRSGSRRPDRVSIYYREVGGDTVEHEVMESLKVAEGELFGRTFTRVRKSFQYYVKGGDDRVPEADWITVEALPRPRVERVVLTVTPPDYIKGEEPKVLEGQGSTRLLQGTKVVMDVVTNKGIAADAQGRPKAQLVMGEPAARRSVTMEFSEAGLPPHQVLRASFEVEQTAPFNFTLVCVNEFSNEPGEDYYLVAVEDEAPRVRLVLPRQAMMDVTQRSVVPVEVEVKDDCGITKTALGWERRPGGQKGAQGLALVEVSEGSEARPLALASAGRWDLRDISPDLNVGDELVYRAVAVDNFLWRGQGPHMAESQEYRLRVVALETMTEALRKQLSALGLRVGDLVKQQEDVQSKTKETRSQKTEAQPLSQKGRDETVAQESQQRQLKVEAKGLEKEFGELLDQFRLHRIPQDEAFERVNEVQQGLKEVADDPMPKAADALRAARDAEAQPQQQSKSLDTTVAEQQRVLDRLRDPLGKLRKFTDAENLAQDLRKILRDQQTVTGATKELAAKTIGKEQNELTPEEREAQQSSTRRQDEIGKELSDAVSRISEAAERLADSDPAVAAALKETGQEAQTRDPVKKMQNASKQIAQNQAAAAGANQQSAEQDVAALIEKLENRREQELKSQIADLEQMKKELGDLKKKEEGHLQENKDEQAGRPQAAKPQEQSPKQQKTSEQTKQLADKMSQAGTPAATPTQGASQSMSQASSQLGAEQSPEAQEKQEESLKQLDQAGQQLQQDIEQAKEELAQEQLEKIKQKLARIKDGEVQVRAATGEIDVKKTAGQIVRSDREKLVFTRDQQKELLTETGGLVKQLEEENVKVFTFALGIVADRMTESHARLLKTETDKITQTSQDKAISVLDRLVKALEEEMSNRKKKKGGAGGEGQGGQQGNGPLVPTLAELKMLKSMQEEINTATAAVDETVKIDKKATPETEAEAKRVGGDQEKVKQLMEGLADPQAGQKKGGEL